MTDDDRLVDLLRGTAARIDPPPPAVAEAARAALSTRRVDEELAALIADSDLVGAGVVRDGGDEPRLLVFETAGVSLELQVEHVGARVVLRGLVTGARGPVVVETPGGRHTAQLDAEGWFTVPGLAAGGLRVRLRGDDGTPVTTSWVRV
ncbi:hypothetical protein ACTG9Q_14025 [Actinokineospora sp. 24-640]